ncbi:acylphosphatase [uncultured Alcanivorax sp.]|jgi:acylphosphatase|uniref:acylphosphatase n=1 Tax=uncultured Alcanivorax sp. TaxID=191215 RepID=UPI002615680C|nr:acylphosphatase [uncultured Alcanivorax sp.]
MMAITKHVLVSGRVQGVGYRAWTQHQASLRNLAGWVRNCDDGRVEAILHGPPDAVSAMLDAMRQGPAMARVDEIITRDSEAPQTRSFEVTR